MQYHGIQPCYFVVVIFSIYITGEILKVKRTEIKEWSNTYQRACQKTGCVIFITYEWDFKCRGSQLSFSNVALVAHGEGFYQAPRWAQVILAE